MFTKIGIKLNLYRKFLRSNNVALTGKFFCQVVEAGSDDSLSNDEDPTTRKRRDILTRRPSYRKILNDLGGADISGSKTTFYKPLFGLFCFSLFNF